MENTWEVERGGQGVSLWHLSKDLIGKELAIRARGRMFQVELGVVYSTIHTIRPALHLSIDPIISLFLFPIHSSICPSNQKA